jgi:hypothetical protein
MIVAVGADKGAPGASTLAVVLGMVWPGLRVVCECDPRGADVPYRLAHADGQPLRPSPSLAGWAVDTRPGSAPVSLERYAQPTVLRVPVIAGEVSSQRAARLATYLPGIAASAADWPGTVIADLGPLHSSNPAMVLAAAATVVLLVVDPTVEGLGHLRDRVGELTAAVGDPRRAATSVGVVVRAPARQANAAVERTATLLGSVGSPASVVGAFHHDPAGAAALWSGPVTKRLTRSELIRSGQALVARLWQLWPELSEPAGPLTARADPSEVRSSAQQERR